MYPPRMQHLLWGKASVALWLWPETTPWTAGGLGQHGSPAFGFSCRVPVGRVSVPHHVAVCTSDRAIRRSQFRPGRVPSTKEQYIQQEAEMVPHIPGIAISTDLLNLQPKRIMYGYDISPMSLHCHQTRVSG